MTSGELTGPRRQRTTEARESRTRWLSTSRLRSPCFIRSSLSSSVPALGCQGYQRRNDRLATLGVRRDRPEDARPDLLCLHEECLVVGHGLEEARLRQRPDARVVALHG